MQSVHTNRYGQYMYATISLKSKVPLCFKLKCVEHDISTSYYQWLTLEIVKEKEKKRIAQYCKTGIFHVH